MASHLLSLVRWLALLTIASLLATACVRSEPPSQFYCASQNDCEDGEVCRGSRCVPAGSCQFNSDCDDGLQICRDQQCVTVACTNYQYEDCGGYACDENDGNVCFTSCATDSNCWSSFHCEQSRCVEGPRRLPNDITCSLNADCESGNCCARGSGKVCSDRCEPAGAACTTAKDCKDSYCCARFPSGSVCSATACLGVRTCTSNSDCSAGEICNAGKCQNKLGNNCASNADCDAGETCNAGNCQKKLGNGAACTAGTQCVSGRCTSGKCLAALGDACQTDTDCALEQTCCILEKAGKRECAAASASCLRDIGEACRFDSGCAEDLCQYGLFCSKPCFESEECGTGPFGANVCVEGLPDSVCHPGCTSDAQCQSIYDSLSFCVTDGEASFCDVY